MPRIRSVHPDICTDEVVAQIGAEAERMWVRLWTHLDDEGRCVDNPRLIRAALFPLLDDVFAEDVDVWLDLLADAELIRRYKVDGRRYLTAKPIAWARWQKPRRKVESRLPPPPKRDNVRTPRDIGGHCAPVVVGGDGGEMETETEGESEGEPTGPFRITPPVDNATTNNPTPLRQRIASLDGLPPTPLALVGET